MQVQVSGKQVDVGEALGSRISQELEEGVGKYFARGGDDAEGTLTFSDHGDEQDISAPEDVLDLESVMGG